MKLSIAIPVMGQLEDTKGQWGTIVSCTADRDNVELVVIDNGSTDGTRDFIERFIFPKFPDHKYVHNQENVGVIASMNQALTESRGDVIALLHNDVYLLEWGWDVRVIKEFERDDKLGLAGFLGAEGCGETGGRMNTYSNLLEAEIHGIRDGDIRKVAIFDGLALIGRRSMFANVGGFDSQYTYHHFYDRDMSLLSLTAGWHNTMIGIYAHHRSGVTANRPDYQTWIDKQMGTSNFTGDQASYLASEQRFIHKWRGRLPIYPGQL